MDRVSEIDLSMIISSSMEKVRGKEWSFLLASAFAYSSYWAYSFRPKDFPPGPFGWPFIGTLYYEKDQAQELLDLGKRYGPVFSVSKMGIKPCVIVNDFEVYRADIKPNFKVFVDRPQFGLSQIFEGDKGIIFSKGGHWEATRIFGSIAMKQYGMGRDESYKSIWEEAAKLVELLNEQLITSSLLDPSDFIQMAVTNVIAKLVFGERFDYKDKALEAAISAFKNTVFDKEMLYRRILFDYGSIVRLVPKSLLKNVHEFKSIFYLIEYINHKVEEAKKSCDRNQPQSVLDYFIIEEESNPNGAIAQRNVLARCILDLFFAGSDTTQNIIRWSLQFLCVNANLQDMLYKEFVETVGESNYPLASHFMDMPLLNAFTHEVMRYVSLTPLGLQHAPTIDCKIGGFHVPAGTPVFVNQFSIHRDPRYWKHPHEFNIKNFLNDERKFEPVPQFMPFGWGKRICLGSPLARVEILVFLGRLIKEYRFQFPCEYNMEPEGDLLRRPARQPIIFSKRGV